MDSSGCDYYVCKGNTLSRESVTLGLKIADVGENNLRRVGRGHVINEE